MSKTESVVLSTGVKAIVRAVPSYMVDNMVAKIVEPRPPRQFIKEKDREEENPFDPAYLEAVDKANHDRGLQTMKAMIMFGIELVDGVPDLDTWLPRLQWMEKNSNLDLAEYDLEEPLDLEFVYKAFVATSGVDLMLVTMKSGMTNREVELAMSGFRGDQEPDPDPAGDGKI